MTNLEQLLSGVIRDLEEHGRGAALVGGLAVSARSEPRFTRDIDLALSVPDDAAAESVVYFLQNRGYTLLATVEQERAGRLATARLLAPGQTEDGVVIDLLFASSGIEHEVVREASSLDILPGVVVPVATAGHLLALKLLSRDDGERPQDSVDIRSLIDVMDDAELDRARRAVQLIESRGYNRGRPLSDHLDELLY